jgi:ATP-dependent DNA helicase RecG
MTATPIPRTLALTVYGDLDVSVLDESPPGRGRLTTAVRGKVDTSQLCAFLEQQLANGRQAYIVYPLVEESDTLTARAATAEHGAWQERFPHVPVGLVHGRLKPEQKDAVMDSFRAGETRILVSTTVIEVGIDVPNASVMLVFDADRFGLAQLHQLRGRIGRGPHQSFCILLCPGASTDAIDRLRILERTRDGFEIAEADLRLRGPGELLGSRQSGLPGLRLGDLIADAPIVHHARTLALDLLARDPDLSLPAHQRFRSLLVDPDTPGAIQ